MNIPLQAMLEAFTRSSERVRVVADENRRPMLLIDDAFVIDFIEDDTSHVLHALSHVGQAEAGEWTAQTPYGEDWATQAFERDGFCGVTACNLASGNFAVTASEPLPGLDSARFANWMSAFRDQVIEQSALLRSPAA